MALCKFFFEGPNLTRKCMSTLCLAKFCLAAVLFSVPNLTRERERGGGEKDGETGILISKKLKRDLRKTNTYLIFFLAASFACVLCLCIYIYIYKHVHVCVSVHFCRHMQKGRRNLEVMSKVLLCMLTARLENNDLMHQHV